MLTCTCMHNFTILHPAVKKFYVLCYVLRFFLCSTTVRRKRKINCTYRRQRSSNERIGQWRAGSDKTRISPLLIFLHCYTHQLNLDVKQMFSDISLARIFFANVSSLSSFLAYSSERTDLVKAVRKRALPHCAQTR